MHLQATVHPQATYLERKHSILLICQGRAALEFGNLLSSTDFGEARVLELARHVKLPDQLAERLLGEARLWWWW